MMPGITEPEVLTMLREAGWHPGRRAMEAVAGWQAALAPAGFVLHSAAETVLREFGGLVVGKGGSGAEQARAVIRLDPTVAIGERDRLQEYFEELRGRGVYPLGEVDDGHAFLGIAEDGEVVLVMDELFDRWPSFAAALSGLLLGFRSQAV